MGNVVNQEETPRDPDQYWNNNHASSQSSGKKSGISGYREVRIESTPNLGQYTLYEPEHNPFNELVLAKEVKCDKEEHLRALKILLTKRMSIRADFLAEMKTFVEKIETDWCSKYYRMYLVYEYSPLTLEKELWDRFKMVQQGQEGKVNFPAKPKWSPVHY